MLTILEKVSFLQNVPLFHHVRTESLTRVASVAQEVNYEERQALYRENEAADCMFVLLEGEVALVRDGQETRKLAPPDVAGALPLLADESQPDSALATRPTRVLQIDQQDFFDAMAEDFHITRGILRALVRPAATP